MTSTDTHARPLELLLAGQPRSAGGVAQARARPASALGHRAAPLHARPRHHPGHVRVGAAAWGFQPRVRRARAAAAPSRRRGVVCGLVTGDNLQRLPRSETIKTTLKRSAHNNDYLDAKRARRSVVDLGWRAVPEDHRYAPGLSQNTTLRSGIQLIFRTPPRHPPIAIHHARTDPTGGRACRAAAALQALPCGSASPPRKRMQIVTVFSLSLSLPLFLTLSLLLRRPATTR